MRVRCTYDKLVPISELQLDPDNRNQHPEEQIVRLAEILAYQGWRYPVKVSKQTGIVRSGHGRISAAILNQWDKVPVNFQDYDTPEQEYADAIADNAIATWAELDLSAINSDIGNLGPDFEVNLLGVENLEPINIETAPPPETKNTNAELDIDAFDNFQHTCPKCNFGWNDV